MAIQLHSCYNGGAEGNTRFFICHHRSVAYWKSRFPSARKPANDRQRTYAFRGNMFEPKNEQGTIVFFQQVCHQLGYEIVTIQAAYPDAILHDCNNNRDLRVEFEYNSNNFGYSE